jgi:hypothetical protein
VGDIDDQIAEGSICQECCYDIGGKAPGYPRTCGVCAGAVMRRGTDDIGRARRHLEIIITVAELVAVAILLFAVASIGI